MTHGDKKSGRGEHPGVHYSERGLNWYKAVLVLLTIGALLAAATYLVGLL